MQAIPEPIRSRGGRWLRKRQRAPVSTTRPTPVSALASAPQEQAPGVIQDQRYTSKACATSERIQQRRQRGRRGERKCVFFCVTKKKQQTNKQKTSFMTSFLYAYSSIVLRHHTRCILKSGFSLGEQPRLRLPLSFFTNEMNPRLSIRQQQDNTTSSREDMPSI